VTADDVPRPHRPALFADLTEMIDAAGGTAPASRAEIAAATAAVVVRAGRTPGEHNDGGQRFVGLADEVGLETLAALWRDAEPVSLPGALWALYLLRQWCRTNPIEVTRLWRAGEPLAPADAAVAGVSDYADVAAIQRLPDAVLAGVYTGDLAVALERAAAFFRVVAAGRRYLLEDDSDPQLRRSTADDMRGSTADDMRGSTADEMALAEGNERAAAALSASARRWRAGTLR
jgi:hypothetical protein